MIGDSSVGKTSLVIRYDEDSFSTKYMTTIGVDYRDKFVQVDGRPIKLQIWDTAGQERFRSLTANFFGKADGFVVCFDVASRTSFAQVRNWIHDVQLHKRGEVDVCLCGCKCDVDEARRQVPETKVSRTEASSAFQRWSSFCVPQTCRRGRSPTSTASPTTRPPPRRTSTSRRPSKTSRTASSDGSSRRASSRPPGAPSPPGRRPTS